MNATISLLARGIATLTHNAAVFASEGRELEACLALFDAGEHLDAVMALVDPEHLYDDAS